MALPSGGVTQLKTPEGANMLKEWQRQGVLGEALQENQVREVGDVRRRLCRYPRGGDASLLREGVPLLDLGDSSEDAKINL